MANELECIVDNELVPITEETPYSEDLMPVIEETRGEPMEFREMTPGGFDGVVHNIYGRRTAFTTGFNSMVWHGSYWDVPNSSSKREDHVDFEIEDTYPMRGMRYHHGGYSKEYNLGRGLGIIAEIAVDIYLAAKIVSTVPFGPLVIWVSFGMAGFAKVGVRSAYKRLTGYHLPKDPTPQLPEKEQCLLEGV